jgi:hypothetical protein
LLVALALEAQTAVTAMIATTVASSRRNNHTCFVMFAPSEAGQSR